MDYYMTDTNITAYLHHLEQEERAEATIEKYCRALRSFSAFLRHAAVTPEAIRDWKDSLRTRD